MHRAITETLVGRTYFHAEDYDNAIVWLEKSSRRCGVPVDSTHAFYWLGRAHAEAKHDQAACKAFSMAVKRWGKAKPRSVAARVALASTPPAPCPSWVAVEDP